MKVIYADFNDFDAQDHLPLTCAGSRTSIAELGEPLQENEEVLLTDGELRVKARVRRIGQGAWEAYGDWNFEQPVSRR